MEEISHLVSASFARHGFATQVDHRRLQWSQWFPCESGFSALPVPSKPGLFALAVEAPAGDTSVDDEKRALTVLVITETEDLGMALGRLFLRDAAEREKLAQKPCYSRYAVIEDDEQRHATYRSLRAWMAASNDITAGTPENLTVHSFIKASEAKDQRASLNDDDAVPLARTGS